MMLFTKSKELAHANFFSNTLFALIFLLISRVLSMWFIPLNDSTEARYGEIARKMLETGNWVTPLHDYGVPFWAKPPLSTWLSALSMKWFGVNEFAVRLPGLLLSIGVLWLVGALAKKHSGPVVARAAVLVLASTLYFFLDAGTVMTDPSLLFCVTLAVVSFWRALSYQQKIWSYVFFVSLGLGLLAKGPIAIVLVGLPLFFWVLIRNQWLNLWKSLPWFTGVLIALVIALPWYVLAEQRTPGFLNYFIIGEHINRFLVPGWTGDKYGMAHHAPFGMVWVYAIAGIFPWSLLCSPWLIRYWRGIPSLFGGSGDGWLSYLFLCMATPLLFFTFSSNIIYPYVFPSLPMFALFFTEMWNRSHNSLTKSRLLVPLSLSTGFLFLLGVGAFNLKPELIAKTQKFMVTAWKQQHPAKGSQLLYWAYQTEFSAQFYAHGKVAATRDLNELQSLLANRLNKYLVVKVEDLSQIPETLLSQFKEVANVRYKGDKLLLLSVKT